MTQYGQYELLELIGAGGMAEVYRARLTTAHEEHVVVKRLRPTCANDPESVRRFSQEASLAAEVQHENVVQIYELGQAENGELFIAMEDVPGTDLRQLFNAAIKNGIRIPPWLSVHIVSSVLDALAYAHALTDPFGRPRNVVHCDVNPENIFLSRFGVIKLGDFGVALDDGRLRIDEEPKGKIAYMSPEQLNGERPGAQSDVFAAGVVLWECLTQQRLFARPTQPETIFRVCNAERVPPSRINQDIPFELDRCVMRALQLDPERRYPSADLFRDLLREVLETLHCDITDGAVSDAITQIVSPVTPAPTPDESTTYTIINKKLPSELPPPSTASTVDTDDLIREYLGNFDIPGPGSPAQVETGDIAKRRFRRPTRGPEELSDESILFEPPVSWTEEKPESEQNVLWVRTEEGELGPFAPRDAIAALRLSQDACVQISADQVRWLPLPLFARLLGDDVEGDAPAQMLFSGSIESHPVLTLLGHAAKNQLTGRLVFVRPTTFGDDRREVHFRDGHISDVFSSSWLFRIIETLLDDDSISEEQLDACLFQMTMSEEPLDNLVAKIGLDIEKTRTRLMVNDLLELLTWTEATYAFLDRSPARISGTECSVYRLMPTLIYQTKRESELEALLTPFMGYRLYSTPHFDRAIRQMALTEQQLTWFALFGTGKTLREVIEKSVARPEDRKRVLTVALVLLQLGLQEIAETATWSAQKK